MAVEAVLVLLTVVGYWWLLSRRTHVQWLIQSVGVLLTVLTTWHIVAIPICFFYLIGRPIVMTLSPLFPSAESRTFRKELQDVERRRVLRSLL